VSPLRSEKFGVWEWSALAAYVGLVAVEARHHTSWADEAQAWLLARDCSLHDLLLHRLHYEGTPGLWHLLLWVLARIGLPYAALHWLTAGIATVGVGVWLRWSPFPRFLKLLFPFTFFVAYQYAVVARSYTLFSLLVFAACALIGSRDRTPGYKPRPLLTALVLGLLANLCMYGTMAAIGLALVYADRLWRRTRSGFLQRSQLRGSGLAAAILFVACALAALQAWPAKDVAFTTGIMDLPSVQKLLHRQEPVEAVAANQQPSWTMNPEDAKLAPPHTGSWLKDRLWRDSHKFYAGATQQARHVYRTERSIFAASLLMFPFSGSMLLAYLAVAGLLYRCVRQRFAIGLLPFVLIFAASVAIYSAEHHTGLLLVAFVAVAWISWREKPVLKARDRELQRWMEIGLRTVLLAIFIVQIGWTLHAVRAEWRTPYSGDYVAAKFLRQHAAGKKIAGYYSLSVGPEAYFPAKIYFNQPTSYWQYSKDPRLTMSNADVLAGRPDYVVLGTIAFRHQMILNQILPMLDTQNDEPGDIMHVGDFFSANGYHETHRFCGLAPMRSGFSGQLCQVVLEPVR
jgi:hypothetical protein